MKELSKRQQRKQKTGIHESRPVRRAKRRLAEAQTSCPGTPAFTKPGKLKMW